MSAVATMPHTENGITVDFPDANYFQFETCPGYLSIKNQSVSEMDLGWWDAGKDMLYLVEMKNLHDPSNPKFQSKDLSQTTVLDELIDHLERKTLHSVAMLETKRSGAHKCVPSGYTSASKVQAVHIINCLPGQELELDTAMQILNQRLQPCKAIFRMNGIVVVPYSIAPTIFPFVK